ncbi:MAG: hypothetical protein PHQ81_08845, partial [Methanofollis sp.]|nr:hypothetical protein [Methanofollis sp.]
LAPSENQEGRRENHACIHNWQRVSTRSKIYLLSQIVPKDSARTKRTEGRYARSITPSHMTSLRTEDGDEKAED